MFHSRICTVGVLLAAAIPTQGMPWIATSYYEQVKSTIAPQEVIGGKTFSADVLTETAAITVTKSPIPTPISQSTSINTLNDLTLVSALLPSGAGRTVDPYGTLHFNNYYIAMTFSAPSRCPSPHWTITTSILVNVPFQVTPTPIATLPNPTWQKDDTPNLLLDQSDVNSVSKAKLSSLYGPLWADQCTVPYYVTASGASSGPYSGGSSDGSSSDCLPFELLFAGHAIGGGYQCDDGEHWTWGTTLVGLICAWIFSFLGFFLICGLIESFVSFRSLCRGKTARRGMPICFAFMFPILSCFFLLGINRGFVAKPPEEQQRLQRRWDEIGFGTKLGQWFAWGFRWGYPPFLGPEPPRKGTHYHPGVHYYAGQGGPPGQPPPMMQQPYGAPLPAPDPMSPYKQPYVQQYPQPYPQTYPQAPVASYQQPGSPYYYDARSPGSISQNASPQPVGQSPFVAPSQQDISKGSPVQEHTTPVSPYRSIPTSPNAPSAALTPGRPPSPPRTEPRGPAELQ